MHMQSCQKCPCLAFLLQENSEKVKESTLKHLFVLENILPAPYCLQKWQDTIMEKITGG